MPGIDDRALAAAIGAEIAYWRRHRGIDRKSLGKSIRKSANTVGRYERGNTMPTISETWRICEALNVSVAEFVGRVDQVVRRSGIQVTARPDGSFLVTSPDGDQIVMPLARMTGEPIFPDQEKISEEEKLRNVIRDAEFRLAAKRGRVEPDDQ